MTDEQFAWWLVGLVDGEGHFGVTVSTEGGRRPFYRCVFRVTMSAVDCALLEMAHERTGWGRLYGYDGHGKYQQPYTVWTTTTKAVGAVADFFESYPLQSKKRAEFEMWVPAARAQMGRSQRGPGRRDNAAAEVMATAYEALRSLDRGGRLRKAAA